MMIELLSQPWPWYVAGPLIAFVMFLLLYLGGNFGVSANLRTLCALGGADRVSDFFRFNWRNQIWNLVFVLGAVLGGFLAHRYLTIDPGINLNPNTIAELEELGIRGAGEDFIPLSLFNWDHLLTVKGIMLLLGGGFLVGFGARYAGGCTSGHAISGLSDLQIPSLIAVIGFFIGGLFVTYLILPILI